MRPLCNHSPSLPVSFPPLLPGKISSCPVAAVDWPQRTLIAALSGYLSFSLALSSSSCLALTLQTSTTSASSSSTESHLQDLFCREEESEESQTAPELVTNEGIVEEAWEIVNDSFLDTGRGRWSPESWLQKKEDITSTSIQSRNKAHEVIKRMLASLGDPYTRFLSPTEFSKMARYDMTGIGINIREVPNENGGVKLKILGLILNGPAHNAGVKQGDELLSVNGMDVRGKSAFEASSLLQGPSDTFVNITVKHGNCGPVQAIEVQRQSTARTPVFYRLEKRENDATSVGYVRLKEFNALARKDLVAAMMRLQDMGASVFILDLRDNRGGLVQAGIEIAKLFLNEGETVIYTEGRDPQYVKNVTAETCPLFTAPIIVLVNKNTASASEIVATALHDNCKAVLVGERTFGKGLIQSVFELHDGSGVVVTVGKYVTPKHMDITGNGVEPDFQKLPASREVTERMSKCQKPQEG